MVASNKEGTKIVGVEKPITIETVREAAHQLYFDKPELQPFERDIVFECNQEEFDILEGMFTEVTTSHIKNVLTAPDDFFPGYKMKHILEVKVFEPTIGKFKIRKIFTDPQ